MWGFRRNSRITSHDTDGSGDVDHGKRQPFIFISYRREDTSTDALWLGETLSLTFGPTSVFIDSTAIQIGSEWPDELDSALRKATVLIAMIGPSWLHAADEYARRRLDNEDDWVRREIMFGLNNKLIVIPLLVKHAHLPSGIGLPNAIATLVNHQVYELRTEHYEHDLTLLLSRLESLGFKSVGPQVSYPRPHVWPKELSEDQLGQALKRLPNWALIRSTLPDNPSQKRTELMRNFEFHSFEDAIDFMAVAARYISDINHHPRWENLWRTVTVYLTTWDIGHKPSRYDLELAEYLETLFANYRKLGEL